MSIDNFRSTLRIPNQSSDYDYAITSFATFHKPLPFRFDNFTRE